MWIGVLSIVSIGAVVLARVYRGDAHAVADELAEARNVLEGERKRAEHLARELSATEAQMRAALATQEDSP